MGGTSVEGANFLRICSGKTRVEYGLYAHSHRAYRCLELLLRLERLLLELLLRLECLLELCIEALLLVLRRELVLLTNFLDVCASKLRREDAAGSLALLTEARACEVAQTAESGKTGVIARLYFLNVGSGETGGEDGSCLTGKSRLIRRLLELAKSAELLLAELVVLSYFLCVCSGKARLEHRLCTAKAPSVGKTVCSG